MRVLSAAVNASRRFAGVVGVAKLISDDLDQEWLKEAAQGRLIADVPCPLCMFGTKHPKKKVLRIYNKGEHFTFHCARCKASGGGRGGNSQPRERSIADQLAEEKRAAEDKAAEERERKAKIDKAERYWSEAVPIADTPGENWLASRGIDINRVPGHGDLRWHPACPLPSVVSRYTNVLSAEPQGIRRRPIDGNNAEFLGPSKSAVVRLWPEVGEHLCVAGGVETARFGAAGVTLYGKLLQPMWACLSAGNLEVLPVLPRVAVLIIIVDNDKSGTGQSKARKCAGRWQEAGRSVMLITPKQVGFDLNDFNVGYIAPPIEIKDLVEIEILEPKLQAGRGAISAHAAREQFEQVLSE